MIQEIENRQGHDLKNLFENLNYETQEYIARFINKNLKSHPFYSFDKLLERARNVFVDWRYIYEEEHSEGFMGCFINEYLMFFEYFITVLKELAHKSN